MIDAIRTINNERFQTRVEMSQKELRTSAIPMHGMAHADLKHLTCGTRSTFMSANYYHEQRKARRDELLKKFAQEE